ncbi:MAG: tetratricopeptide repeat protein [Bacteroidia bacterium]|nr:tetratricopeptide repeat protein [Bacteroidia bacterium]MDW8089217.1 tetratricopeptide repeat protein [Bacteroidia bacterium]
MYRAIGALVVGIGLLGCSAEKNTFLARSWHTFVSYFNGYYHAEQRFRWSQREIELQTPDPTEGFIRIYPIPDPNYARSQYSRLEEAAKKCEVIIFRHKNGNYIDDSRTLIGQTWVLRSNLPNADMNFIYVLNAFPNTPLRARVYWWQAYAALQEDNPYRAEMRLTEALGLPDRLKRRYKPHLDALMAQTLVAKGQPELALPFLQRSANRLDTRLRRARAYYLMGQLYLQQKNFAQAEQAFRKVYRLNATNGLTFLAQLQLSLLVGAKNPRLIRRLERMARSARYEDYRDQIYYRIGQLQAEKGQYEAALQAYKKAGQSGQSPARALAHYEAGLLYFEKFHDLAAAQKHFDTAATLIPEKHSRATEIKMLQTRFKEYARLRAQVHRSDSLLTLAALGPEAQERAIESYIQAEVARRALEKSQRASEQTAASSANPLLTSSSASGRGGGFYFDNPIQVSNGRQEFIRLWGERPDEDHWRRWHKGPSAQPSSTPQSSAPKAEATEGKVEWPESPADLTPLRVEQLKKQLLATLPRTAAQKRAVEDTLIEATLALAQLYQEALQRPDSAQALYEWLIRRLPHRPEAQAPALYALSILLSGKPAAETYKRELLARFPDSEYARLLTGKGRLEARETPVTAIHQTLLTDYNGGDYAAVVGFAEATQSRWQGTEAEPFILYLIAAAYVHLQELEKAASILRQLIQKHPKAECTPLAQKLLTRIERGQTQLIAESNPAPPPTPSPPTSANLSGFVAQLRPDEALLVVLLVPKERITAENLRQELSRAHERYFSGQRLSLVVFLYNDTHHLAYIAQFSDYRTAENYIQTIAREPWYASLGLQAFRDFFPISQSNFRVAFTQKRMQDYAAFYTQYRSQFR